MEKEQIKLYLDNKTKNNDPLIQLTFFELRVKLNLTVKETKDFIREAMDYYTLKGYKVYQSNEEYIYKYMKHVVQSNELLVVVKNKD